MGGFKRKVWELKKRVVKIYNYLLLLSTRFQRALHLTLGSNQTLIASHLNDQRNPLGHIAKRKSSPRFTVVVKPRDLVEGSVPCCVHNNENLRLQKHASAFLPLVDHEMATVSKCPILSGVTFDNY